MLTSKLCCYADFQTEWYMRQAEELGLEPDIKNTAPEQRNIHRKAWEWCAITEALHQRGMLEAGRNGLGFAVGTEPLASAFAARGVSVLGTDLASDQAGWSGTNEHAASLEALYHAQIVRREIFDANVRFMPVDMRDISGLPGQGFDFVWSSCSFEHLGTLEAGLRFVMDAMRLVKPGGFAVHTTEYNVSSNETTIESGSSVIYRRKDIEALGFALRGIGCGLEQVDFSAGLDPEDFAFDFSPYYHNGRYHIKLLLGNHVSTSVLLVIRKGISPPAEVSGAIPNPFRQSTPI